MRAVRLARLRVGNHVIKDVIANVAPVKGGPLLGQSFLSKLPGWAIDNRHHALILHDVTVGEFMEWYRYCVSAKSANKEGVLLQLTRQAYHPVISSCARNGVVVAEQ
jgi:hypothetical protein